jgi:DNA-binding transcriptional MerR regulator
LDDPGTTETAALTIGDLAQRTGLSPATLRMWESRHGFPVPQRLGSGHRRYTEGDVETIRSVVRHQDAGTRLEQAIARAMADAEPSAPSVYAHLRRRHPGLGVHRLKKSTLTALSWAIEDEFCAKADRATIYAAFQHERYYRASQDRWTELARVSAGATVFADFEDADAAGSPREVHLPADAPMRREWAVVCDAVDLPVALTAWELPGQGDVPEPRRLFESMWTVDGAAVHDAAKVCAGVARAQGVSAEPSGLPLAGGPHTPDTASVTHLFNRMVAYVDRIGDR